MAILKYKGLTVFLILSAIFSLTRSKRKPAKWDDQPENYATDNDTKHEFDTQTNQHYGQNDAIRNSWASTLDDQFPDLFDNDKKVKQINYWNYEEMIVDPEDGEFISETPWFLIFVHGNNRESNVNIEAMQHLAYYFDGKVRFGFIAAPMEEALCYAYEVHSWPRSFYIDQDGMAHAFPKGFVAYNATKKWIEEREFKKSPQIFKAPNRVNKVRLIWGYLKKDVRTWYMRELQPKIEPTLRKVGFTYIVDMDPLDFDNIKLNQKTNRQIIFIVAAIVWVLELIWDMIVAQTCPAAKPKRKSIVGSKKKATEDEKTDTDSKADSKKKK